MARATRISFTAVWLAVAVLGMMPVGAAIYTWDHGVRHGNIQMLDAATAVLAAKSMLFGKKPAALEADA